MDNGLRRALKTAHARNYRISVTISILLLGRVALVAQRPIVIKLSRGRSVGLCVDLSSALWKNGGSDPDAVWHHRSHGSRDKAGSGFGDRFTERGTFGGEFGARHCNQWGLYGVRVRQCRDAALFPSQITLGKLVTITIIISTKATQVVWVLKSSHLETLAITTVSRQFSAKNSQTSQ